MTSKLFFAVGFGGLLVATLLFSANKKLVITEQPQLVESQQDVVAAKPGPSQVNTARVELVTSNGQGGKSAASTNSVDEQIIELTELGARNDAESLKRIIARLSDSDPQIREAALDATIQFGSRDAIPILEELATKTDDPRERIDSLDGAKFLALPTFSEIRAQRRTNLNSKALPTSQN